MVEALESRVVPYATIGAWPHPELVTISFMPDGTNLGGSLSSNLFATFNSKWSPSIWQQQILLAAQTWAMYTNLNFAAVADDGLPFGWAAYQQGNAGEGDIRVSGFNFGTTDLVAAAWFPPPVNNSSVAGAVFFNTAQPFNIGSTYDIYTVAVHELGHALGLLHSTDYYASMYGAYVGVKSYGLTADDIAGIRSLYSGGAPRSADGFGFYTNSFQTAADLTGAFDPATQTLVGAHLDLSFPGQAEYYRFLAPYGTSSQLTITIQSSGLSLLSPFVVLYDAYQRPIAAASGYGQYGTTVTVTVGGVVPTELFWLRVSGAGDPAMMTGRYALIVNFGTGPSPIVPPANTATPNGVPHTEVGGWPEEAGVVQADGPGFDSFELKPDEVGQRTGSGSAPRSTPAERALAHLPSSESAALAQYQSQVLASAVQLPPGAAVTGAAGILLRPMCEPRSPQPVYARTVGGGNNVAPLSPATLLDERTCPPPDSLPNPMNSQPPERATLLGKWRAACTAYFSGRNAAAHHNGGGAFTPCSGEGDGSLTINAAAALTSLAVALGGYWGGQADEVLGWRRRHFGF